MVDFGELFVDANVGVEFPDVSKCPETPPEGLDDLVAASDGLLAEHYAEHVDEPYYDGLLEYMQEQLVIAGRLAGENAVETVRQIIGYKNPVEAESGTIRGEFGTDSFDEADAEGRAVRNLVHASATVAEAERELDLWFGDNDGV